MLVWRVVGRGGRSLYHYGGSNRPYHYEEVEDRNPEFLITYGGFLRRRSSILNA